MVKGRYTRTLPVELTGETALLRPDPITGGWYAQFDNLKKFGRNAHDYAFGWHSFHEDSFELLEEKL